MTDAAVRASVRKSLIVALVVAALCAGFVAHAFGDSATHPRGGPAPTKLSVGDLMLAASTAQGIHMRYTGVTNLPFNPNHSNDAPVDAFAWSVNRKEITPTGGGPPVLGQTTQGHIVVDRTNDQYSLPLFQKSLAGSGPPTSTTATFYFTDLSGLGGAALDYLQIDLTDAQVSGFSMNSGGDRPSEEVTIYFTKATFTYKKVGSGLSIVRWNFVTGTSQL